VETPSNCYSFQWESAPAKSRWNLSPNWGCFQILKMTDQPFVGPLESIEQCRASPSASERCRERRTFRGLCGVRSRMSRVEAVPVLLKSIGLQLRVAIVWLSMKMCQSTAARLPQRDCAIILFFFSPNHSLNFWVSRHTNGHSMLFPSCRDQIHIFLNKMHWTFAKSRGICQITWTSLVPKMWLALAPLLGVSRQGSPGLVHLCHVKN
jgi:hypothetical protein